MGINWLKQRDAKIKKNRLKGQLKRPKRDRFYYTQPWLRLRFEALIKYGRKCQCCYAEGVQLHVDHVKPRHRYPKLGLDINNLQILCARCNIGKGARYENDFRPKDNV